MPDPPPATMAACTVLTTLALAAVASAATAATKPNILFVVADDLGRNDLGFTNGHKTATPVINELVSEGILLDAYHTFKICSPTRASILSGRYPFNAGFYDMANDEDHCINLTTTIMPEVFQGNGYTTHALGKWDVGFVKKACTPTYRGFDTFLGYYTACLADYWNHSAPMGCNATDLSRSAGDQIGGAKGFNGTYDRDVFSDEAIRLINQQDVTKPMFMYLAFQNVHLACAKGRPHGIQAPCATVDMYPFVVNDTYKAQSAMLTELDYGVGNVTAALKAKGMWDNTLVVLVSDNGGPLDHSTNFPLRGGKHTFWDGGVRVMAFVSGPVVPAARRGSVYEGLAHSSDWYRTLLEGVAGLAVPAHTGTVPLDSINLWPGILANNRTVRTEVVHQVSNQWFTEGVSAIRMGDYKLIVGNPGDHRILAYPELSATATAFGGSGGEREPGTDHCRAPPGKIPKGHQHCEPHCLFNLVADPAEADDLSGHTKYAGLIQQMAARLQAVGEAAPAPAHLYPFPVFKKNISRLYCAQAAQRGFLEPIDL